MSASFFESTSTISPPPSVNNNVATRANSTLAKKRKTVCNDHRHAIMESTRLQNAHEAFGTYVSASLAQIEDEHLTKRTKCQIQLVLTKALSEYAESVLASTETQDVLVNGNDNTHNGIAETDEFELLGMGILPKLEPDSPTHYTFEN